MPRAAFAILNELSVRAPSAPASEAEVEAMVDMFVKTLIAARKIRSDLALVTHQGLSTIQVDEMGLTLAAFLQIRGGRGRELLRFIRALKNHAPFAGAPSLEMPEDGEEFRYQDRRADGLGFAAFNRQLATSMRAENWSDSVIGIERTWLEEKGNDVIVREDTVDAKHASTVAHVATHEQFLREMTLPDVLTGAALWFDRDQLFPHLAFLPRTEDQLRRLPNGCAALTNILEQLTKLSHATAVWNPTERPFPDWGIHVTPEHEHRKRLCMFSDLDGQTRCFDLHARFNPAPGRIHFRLVRSGGPKLIVAHVGRKL